MDEKDAATIDALMDLVRTASREGMPRDAFWARFDALAGDTDDRAFRQAQDAPLLERWCDLMAEVDRAGYGGPDDE